MNIRETFLNLTEYTTPFKMENTLEKYLPKGIKKDATGNYYLSIGKSETLFTTHLDNYCREPMKVNHVIDGDKIGTDEKTILGADNKAGCCVLLYLIENNVPGTYYFFIGEEPVLSGGLYGSQRAATNVNLFKRFKRAIAFDRKHTGSIISRQAAQPCISKEFGDALVEEFKKVGMEMRIDPTGYYTDTASFLDIIPECTNISVGVWNEHHNTEYVDISYVEKTAKAAVKINWESLPSVRSIDEKEEAPGMMNYFRFKDKGLVAKITVILDVLGYHKVKEKGNTILYNQWFEEDPIKIEFIKAGKTQINGTQISIYDYVKKEFGLKQIYDCIESEIPGMKSLENLEKVCRIFQIDFQDFLLKQNLRMKEGKLFKIKT